MKKYITGQAAYNTCDRHVPAPYLRKSFVLNKKPQKALLQVYCAGFYRLSVNGTDITKGILAPYIADPEHFVYFDEYDIAPYLLAGENVIGLLLGNGLANSNDNGIWNFERAAWRGAPRAAIELACDGETALVSDASFRTHASPVTFDDYRCGERYDARLEIPGWDTPGFDDSGWAPALEVPSFGGEERPCLAEPVVCYRVVKAVTIVPSGEGYLYDFGENNAGVVRLKVRGAAPGQTIRLDHGEIVKNGKLDKENICFGERTRWDYAQVDEYICRGGEEEYRPTFTYHGFRYVYVTGLRPEQADLNALAYLVCGSDLERCGDFTCSDETANRVFSCTIASDRSNFYYFPTDCPQREKNGWTGDVALSCEQLLYSFDCSASLKQWHDGLVKAQTEQGQLPGIVPTAGWGYEWGNGPAWDLALVELPYRAYVMNGERWDVAAPIKKYLKYLAGKIDGEGLLHYGLGDWCEAGTFSEELYATPLEVTDTIVGADICRKAAVLLRLAGDTDAERAEGIAAGLIFALRKKYLADGILSCRTQTAQAMAIYHGVYTEAEIPAAYALLKRLIEEAGRHFKVGVLGGRVLFEVLARYGDAALALELVTTPTFPSYAYHVHRGATTLWEGFHELTDEAECPVRKDGRTRMLSLNHHFWGFVADFFYRDIAGIRYEPGGGARVQPNFIVSSASAYRDRGGRLSVSWEKRDAGRVAMRVVTSAAGAAVILPEGYAFEDGSRQRVLAAGAHELTAIPCEN